MFRNSFSTKERNSFHKFFLYSPWDNQALNRNRKLKALREMKKVNKDKPFFFLIDDTLSIKKKSSKNIEGLKYNFSHVSKRNEWSHCLVALHGYSKGLSIPLEFKNYLSKDFTTKQTF